MERTIPKFSYVKGLSKLGSGGRVVLRGSTWAYRGSLGRWGNCPGTCSNLPLLLDLQWPVPGLPLLVPAAGVAVVAAASCWGRPHGLLIPSNPPQGLPCHCCYNPHHHGPCANVCSGRWGLGESCSEHHTLQQTQPTVQGQEWPNTGDLQSALALETPQPSSPPPKKIGSSNSNLEVLLSEMWCSDIPLNYACCVFPFTKWYGLEWDVLHLHIWTSHAREGFATAAVHFAGNGTESLTPLAKPILLKPTRKKLKHIKVTPSRHASISLGSITKVIEEKMCCINFKFLPKTNLHALNYFALSLNFNHTTKLPLFLQLFAWAATVASTIQHPVLGHKLRCKRQEQQDEAIWVKRKAKSQRQRVSTGKCLPLYIMYCLHTISKCLHIPHPNLESSYIYKMIMTTWPFSCMNVGNCIMKHYWITVITKYTHGSQRNCPTVFMLLWKLLQAWKHVTISV